MRPVGPWLAVFLAVCFLTVPALARGKSTAPTKPAATKVANKKTSSAKPKAGKKTAKKATPSDKKAAKAPKTLAVSFGHPNDGKLEGARAFKATRYMKLLPDYAKTDAKWALPELLDALDRAAQAVAKKYPGSVLGVADLSAKNGGPIPRHRSHQSGRDVDVGFYLVNEKGRIVRPYGLVNMKADGTSTVRSSTRFDEKRNWAFIAALLQDKKVKVTNIFVWAPLRARLLAHAEKIGAPKSLRQKAAQVMSQPANVQRHADHFHIRIACPDRLVGKGCIDAPRRRPEPTIVADKSKPPANLPALPMLGDDDEDYELPSASPAPVETKEPKKEPTKEQKTEEREAPAEPAKEKATPSSEELEAAAKPKAPVEAEEAAEKKPARAADPNPTPAPSPEAVTG